LCDQQSYTPLKRQNLQRTTRPLGAGLCSNMP